MRRRERDALLEAACDAVLDATEQEVLHLRYVENVGVDEITQLVGIVDKSGARGVLQRCKRKLRAELARRLAEAGHGESLLFGSIEADR
jgi:DNA-directed RNA polymerase specialized sigma subunit